MFGQKKEKPQLHGNDQAYWEYQRSYAYDVLMPLFKKWNWSWKGKRILEVGCSEGGILHAFAEQGAEVVGLEFGKKRVEVANQSRTMEFSVVQGDFCSLQVRELLDDSFDLIIFRDVIEHLYDKAVAMENVKHYLREKGRVFFSFPPWFMPFGGHQQVLPKPWKNIPFLHYLPRNAYVNLLDQVEGRKHLVEDLLSTYDTRITMGQFRRMIRFHDLEIEREKQYLINPAYKLKFGWEPRETGVLRSIPVLREILTTSMYAWVCKSEVKNG